jgi:hypothetical protein
MIMNLKLDPGTEVGRDGALRRPRAVQARNRMPLISWLCAICSARWTRAGTAQRAVPTLQSRHLISVFVWTLLLVAIGFGALTTGCSRKQDAAASTTSASVKTLYTCGMHPWIIQDHPGNCPICGMKLEPVHKTANAAAPSAASSAITVDPATIQMMNIQTVEITRGPLRRTIRTVANVDYNETALADVTTKYKGWIETLYVDATGALVHRGDPLFEIYSPELYSAQTE